jgi:gamma-glutamyltranspeptidase / glutathione hydrolase
MVASADQLATQAGITVLAMGGNAVDGAIATNAAIAITGPHLCGMGGDLFALVHDGNAVHALNSSGRAGSGADPDAMRAEGLTEMPYRHDIRTVTVPGCVDGWQALHERFARLPLEQLLAPAIRLAEEGFPASPLLVGAVAQLDERGRQQLAELAGQAVRPGARVRRPRAAAVLRSIAAGGRNGFYLGDFGRGLLELGDGFYHEADLAQSGAEWCTPLSVEAFGHRLHTMPPNSQGYLLLGAAALADSIGVPADPDDPAWAHLLIEAAKAAGRDRPSVLNDRADGLQLLRAIATRHDEFDPIRAMKLTGRQRQGDTTYLCTVDHDRMGVSLIQSNAAGFGSWLAEPNTGINLHNRGLGFSLEAGHPAELGPRRRPPHTLTPALATTPDGSLVAVFGTMGGDAQPQILLQVAARLFHHGASPAAAIAAPRWVLNGPETGFDTWTGDGGPHVLVEEHGIEEWRDGLAERGHDVRVEPSFSSEFGHAHAILVGDDGMLSGAADPRAVVASTAGI